MSTWSKERIREYKQTDPEKLMEDKELQSFSDRIKKDPDVLESISDEARKRYFATLRWHADRRMSLTSLEGMVVGQKSVQEILDKNKD